MEISQAKNIAQQIKTIKIIAKSSFILFNLVANKDTVLDATDILGRN